MFRSAIYGRSRVKFFWGDERNFIVKRGWYNCFMCYMRLLLRYGVIFY